MRKKIEVKDKRELAERLMLGEPIVTGDGKRLVFDITAAHSPFRYTREGGGHGPMTLTWDNLNDLYIEIPWQENIGKGKLCRVWNDGQAWAVRLLVAYDSSIGRFKDDYGITWQNATPMPPEEIAEYTVQP